MAENRNYVECEIAQGKLRGISKENCDIFLGLPYAKPPVGALRFCPPEAPDAWEGIWDATHFSCRCPQEESSKDPLYSKEFYTDPNYPLQVRSEDGLYLNIWAPKRQGTEKVPVAVWIHGGAFNHGSGTEMEFDGEAYSERGVILVTINYRLGALGFLALPELAAEQESGTCGNYGILDQIQALRWVKENIEAFGGDPDQVTIFGQSAGCMSVNALIASPLTRGLFRGAILMSGASLNTGFGRTMSRDAAYRIGELQKKVLGVSTLEELRALPAERFVETEGLIVREVRNLAFMPIVDDYVLTSTVDEAANEGTIADIPYMIGMTGDDLFKPKDQPAEESAFFAGIRNWAAKRTEISNKPCYIYLFSHKLPGSNDGAFHSSELWYVFHTLHRCWRPMTEEDEALSQRMLGDWVSFIKTGAPGEDWKAYGEDGFYFDFQ